MLWGANKHRAMAFAVPAGVVRRCHPGAKCIMPLCQPPALKPLSPRDEHCLVSFKYYYYY